MEPDVVIASQAHESHQAFKSEERRAGRQLGNLTWESENEPERARDGLYHERHIRPQCSAALPAGYFSQGWSKGAAEHLGMDDSKSKFKWLSNSITWSCCPSWTPSGHSSMFCKCFFCHWCLQKQQVQSVTCYMLLNLHTGKLKLPDSWAKERLLPRSQETTRKY